MELTIDQASLHRALRLVGRIAPAKATLPILQNVLLEAGPGRLTLTATDHEVGLTTSVPADVSAHGRVAVRARLLDDYVAALPPGTLRLSMEEGEARLRAACGRFTAGFPTADPDEFPATPVFDEDGRLDVDAGALRTGIERVAFSAARDDSRPVLRGIRCLFGAHGLSLAACDGFRLARTAVPGAPQGEREAILPARAAVEFGRLLAGTDPAQLAVASGGACMHLRVGETTFFGRLMEGVFPDIERVVPTEWRTRVRVETAALRRAVGVAGLFWTTFAGRPVRLEAVEGRPGALRLHAQGSEAGDAEVELPADVEGDAQHVSLGTPYLAEILAAAQASEVELTWQGPFTPVVVREAGRDDPDDLWVLMPMHTLEVVRSSGTAGTGDTDGAHGQATKATQTPAAKAA